LHKIRKQKLKTDSKDDVPGKEIYNT